MWQPDAFPTAFHTRMVYSQQRTASVLSRLHASRCPSFKNHLQSITCRTTSQDTIANNQERFTFNFVVEILDSVLDTAWYSGLAGWAHINLPSTSIISNCYEKGTNAMYRKTVLETGLIRIHRTWRPPRFTPCYV